MCSPMMDADTRLSHCYTRETGADEVVAVRADVIGIRDHPGQSIDEPATTVEPQAWW